MSLLATMEQMAELLPSLPGSEVDLDALVDLIKNLITEVRMLVFLETYALTAASPGLLAGPTAAPARPTGGLDLLTRDEAAEYLRLSVRSIDTLVSDKRLVPLRFGRSVRFERQALDAFVRASAGDGSLPRSRAKGRPPKVRPSQASVPAAPPRSGEVTP